MSAVYPGTPEKRRAPLAPARPHPPALRSAFLAFAAVTSATLTIPSIARASGFEEAPTGPVFEACRKRSDEHLYEVERLPDGRATAEGCFLNGSPDGYSIEWYPEGKKKAEGAWEQGKKVGLWKTYGLDGTIQTEGRYMCDFQVGPWKIVDARGAPAQKTFPPSADCADLRQPSTTLSATLGYTFIRYEETGHGRFLENTLTAKVSYLLPLKIRRFSVGVVGYGTLASFAENTPGVSMKFYGLNLRLGYSPPWLSAPWKLNLMGGAYFTTTSVTDRRFGFYDLLGPQLAPVIQRQMGDQSVASAYFKYAPMIDSAGFRPGNCELAAGFSWLAPVSGKHALSMGIDVARLQLTYGRTRIASNSTSFSFGYGF